MDSKSRAPVWVLSLAAATVSGLLVVGGCALDKDKNGSQPGSVFNRVGGHSGELLEPKRCLLKVAIVSRPSSDQAISNAVWRVADEQVIPPKERRAWEVNGLRLGRIMGELPLELEAALKETTPQKKVDPTWLNRDSGEPSLLKSSEAVEEASLLLNRDNRVFGNDYKDVSGYFRVTPQHEGANLVSLRLVPEIHYGPIQRTFQALPNVAAIQPQEFRINDGQQEDTIRELATTLVLEPGQVAVIGLRPDHKRSLGSFLLSQSVAHSDQRIEKLILIWASRNLQGQGPNDREANLTDRPRLLKWLLGPAPTPNARPVAPVPEMPADTSLPDEVFPGAGINRPPAKADPKSAAPKEPANTGTGTGTAKSSQAPSTD
ncbi:MAG: hypothetical protein ACHRXM_18960 [Isosphaerales bacterium]